MKKISTKIGLSIIAAVLLIGGGLYYLKYVRDSNRAKPHKTEIDAGRTYPDSPAAAEASSGVTDNAGNTPQSDIPRSDEWVSSESGNITVQQPAANSIIKTGTILSGLAKTTTVSYRIIDDKSGVIGTGTLQVVDGKFSGTFNISSTGEKGRLDVFSAESDGRELNVIEIPVRFK